MTAEELEVEFAAHALRAFTAPGILMLDADHALAIVARAQAVGLPVLGVDGFILDGERTISPLEHVADFSRHVSAGDGSWGAAARFVQERRGQGLAFEV